LKTTSKIIPVDPADPSSEAIAQAARVILSGGVVVFPTTGLYGLGADAASPGSVEKLFRIKGRPSAKPILVLVASTGMLSQVAEPPGESTRNLMARFWPGRVTFLIEAHSGLPTGLTAGSGKIGVRLAAHQVARALVQAVGRPITGTSANLSGAGGCAAIADLDPALIDAVDLILDSGRLAGGAGSTVVDLTGKAAVILREGAVPAADILQAFEQQGRGSGFEDER
jgi:L-threonylcarbamoyladenylate synthase